MHAENLLSNFVVVDATLNAHHIPVTPTLYQDLDRRFSQFRSCILIAEHRFEVDWASWEMHPHGDEILYLLEGAAAMHLLVDGQTRTVQFDEVGSTLIIPKGVWHTAKVLKPCRILFMTPGEGTENATSPP